MENRVQIWEDYSGIKMPYIAHAWLKYNRYFEATSIIASLKEWGEDISKLRILDYGCGVGDYGISFIREGGTVTFYDKYEELCFLEYRMQLEGRKVVDDYRLIEVTEKRLELDTDLVIFGEVLEHLEDTYELLKFYVDNEIKYIFTSSYPYRSSDPNDPYWHHRGHNPELCLLQPQCRELLENNYNFVKYDGEMRLWKRK